MIERFVCGLVARKRLSVERGAAILIELSFFDRFDVAFITISIALGAYLGATT